MVLKTRKKRGDNRRPRKMAPDPVLPRIEIKWTETELDSLAKLASAPDAEPPTEAVIRALRD